MKYDIGGDILRLISRPPFIEITVRVQSNSYGVPNTNFFFKVLTMFPTHIFAGNIAIILKNK